MVAHLREHDETRFRVVDSTVWDSCFNKAVTGHGLYDPGAWNEQPQNKGHGESGAPGETPLLRSAPPQTPRSMPMGTPRASAAYSQHGKTPRQAVAQWGRGALGVPPAGGHSWVRLALLGWELTPGQGLPLTEALQKPGNGGFTRGLRGQRAQRGDCGSEGAPSCPDSALPHLCDPAGLTPHLCETRGQTEGSLRSPGPGARAPPGGLDLVSGVFWACSEALQAAPHIPM